MSGDKPGCYRGRHYTTYVDEVRGLKRSGRLEAAEKLLLHLVDAVESERQAERMGVAPAYYEELAIIYRKQNNRGKERTTLERFARQQHAPGAKPPQLLERLQRLRADDGATCSRKPPSPESAQEANPMTEKVQYTVNAVISSRGAVSYVAELSHHGLHKHRTIRGSDSDIVQRKAELQVTQWAEQWAQRQAKEADTQSRERSKQQALSATKDAQKLLEQLHRTLHHTLDHDDTIDWDLLKDQSSFSSPKPEKSLPKKPALQQVPREPSQAAYSPSSGWLDRLLPSRRERRIVDAEQRYEDARQAWQRRKQQIEQANAPQESDYAKAVADAEAAYERALAEWRTARTAFEEKQRAQNASIDRQRERWLTGDADAVTTYCDLVLSKGMSL